MQLPVPRPDYPRPQWRRQAWQSLNGVWDFAFDDGNIGCDQEWQTRADWPSRIVVPFAFESELSGIHDTTVHSCVWYHRTFDAPAVPEGGTLWLHFGAVDYHATVWLNGTELGAHCGGHVPFRFDIAPHVIPGENHLAVRAFDPPDADQPRGKQAWEARPHDIYYHRTTGIWQTVWLEPVGPVALDRVETVFTREPNHVLLRPRLRLPDGSPKATLRLELGRQGTSLLEHEWTVGPDTRELTLDLPPTLALWSPESPALYDAVWTLGAGPAGEDRVTCELGFRTIEVDGDRLLLNGEPYVQRLVLDQGYYPGGNYTPPSVAAMHADVATIKALGFNGLRKHQKIEDPWFLTWCDRLGLLVWEEMPSALLWSETLGSALLEEFLSAIERDWLHPCIVAWVPYNESWGVLQLRDERAQLADVLRAYATVKARDPGRLCVANSGFFQSVTDVCDPHDYMQDPTELRERLADYGAPEPRPMMHDFGAPLFVPGHQYEGQPVVISEYGGIGFPVDPPPEGDDAFVYGQMARTEGEFLSRLAGLTQAVLHVPRSWGYCYTQLYDIECEINGLLRFDRRPKAPLDRIAPILRGPHWADAS